MVQLDRDLEKSLQTDFNFFLLGFILQALYNTAAKNQTGQPMGSRENASFVKSPCQEKVAISEKCKTVNHYSNQNTQIYKN